MPINARWSAVLLVFALTLPAAAAAQDGTASPESSNPAPARKLVLEEVHDGFAIAPDVRFGKVNGKTATIAGGYGGWMIDKTLLVGGGGYWLANRSSDFKMAYGGAVVEWLVRADQRIGFGTRALVGGGSATLSRPFGDIFGNPPDTSRAFADLHGGLRDIRGLHGHVPHRGNTITRDTPIVVSDTFVIFEPQANAFVSVTRWLRINVGVGYRVVGGSDALDDELRGVSGTVAVQFGGGR
jgi:hypothetical protein